MKGMTGSGYILIGVILGLLIVIPITIYATEKFSGKDTNTRDSLNDLLGNLLKEKTSRRWTLELGYKEFVIIFNKNHRYLGQAFKTNAFENSNLFAIDYYGDRYSKDTSKIALIENPCFAQENCFCKFKLGSLEKLSTLKPYNGSEFPELDFSESVTPSLFNLEKIGECTPINLEPAERYVVSEYNGLLRNNVQIVTFGGVVLAPDIVFEFEERKLDPKDYEPVVFVKELPNEANKFGVNYYFKILKSNDKNFFIACRLENQC